MSEVISLSHACSGIDKDITVTEDLVAVFVSLKVTAVRNNRELTFS